jgi:sarcosine oxidase subunit beta
MERSADVVIIGGGIQGLSLAYHLATLGLTDVCLLEMGMLGSGSSGLSASIIGHAFQSDRMLPLTHRSFQALLRFQDDVGVDPDYEPIGVLILAGKAGATEAQRRHAILESLGVESKLLAREEIRRLTPGLNLAGIELAHHLPRDGCLDAHMIMMGYAGRARGFGVQILEEVEATGFRMADDRITAVETTAGPITARWVVNAAGARAREVASWAGLDLPITNLKRHIVVTGPVHTYDQSIPFTYDWEQSWYMRREGPGLLMGMGAQPVASDDLRVESAMVEAIIDYAIFRAPSMEDAGLMTSWAGLRSMTPDEDPILGLVAHPTNYVNDCGWGGIGVMNAPAAGQALAELIITGAARSVDITPFAAERFAQTEDPQ